MIKFKSTRNLLIAQKIKLFRQMHKQRKIDIRPPHHTKVRRSFFFG